MSPNFCLTCSQPLNKVDGTTYRCDNGHNYWNSPRCGTSVIFLRGDRVLTVIRGIQPHLGKHSFPGGFVQHDEQPWHTAIREAQEEVGVTINEVVLLDAHTQPYRRDESTTTLIYLAKGWQGDFHHGDDAAKLQWKPIDFIISDDFSWHYPGLADKLKALIAKETSS